MGGLRDLKFLDGHAEQVRERVAGWEHHEPIELASTELAEDEIKELRQLLVEQHMTEEELRENSR
jgi:hypothetical protein